MTVPPGPLEQVETERRSGYRPGDVLVVAEYGGRARQLLVVERESPRRPNLLGPLYTYSASSGRYYNRMAVLECVAPSQVLRRATEAEARRIGRKGQR